MKQLCSYIWFRSRILVHRPLRLTDDPSTWNNQYRASGRMGNFASSYNAGHVINAKKAKAVRKALRELENSDRFRPAKGDRGIAPQPCADGKPAVTTGWNHK